MVGSADRRSPDGCGRGCPGAPAVWSCTDSASRRYGSGLPISQYAGAEGAARRQTVPHPVCIDPRRTAILLLGGDKTGNSRWYDEYIPKADAIYEEHLRE